MNKFEKLAALQNSGTFEQELAMVNTAEEMQQLFKNHDVELTLEETIRKEVGGKWAALAAVLPTLLGMGLCLLVNGLAMWWRA